MSIETALQRVDRYIQKQIHKFEQQKRGRTSPPRAYAGYGQLPRQHEEYAHPPSHQHGTFLATSPPPPRIPMTPMAPPGWKQEFDTLNQRWYYVNLSTGRSQWDPPSPNYTQAPLPPSAPPPPLPRHYQPFSPDPPGHSEHGRSADQRGRAASQPHRPISTSGARLGQPNWTSTSGNSLPSSRHSLPPGAHLDMNTGQMVTTMFPPGQDPKAWAHEVGRL